jgi:ribosomal protein S14
MVKQSTHRHEDGEPFRPTERYRLAHRCERCGAPPGVRCVVAGHPNRSAHAKREEAARRHWTRDLAESPWPEEREPGACYSTLPGCGSGTVAR